MNIRSAAYLGLILFGCGSQPSKSAATAATATPSGMVTNAYQVNDGVCTQTVFKEARAASDALQSGTCPTSLTVGGQAATVIKTCASFANGDGDQYTIVVYNKQLTKDNKVQTIDASGAQTVCDAVKNDLLNGG